MFKKVLGIAAPALLCLVACSDDNPSGSFDTPEAVSSSIEALSSDGSVKGVSSSSHVEVGGEAD